MKRFYSNTLPLLLDSDSRHAIKALRCKENDCIEVIDGNGKLYQATILSISRNEIQLSDLKIIKAEENNTQLLSIAIAPTKNPARIEWFVEKATEIGVRNIYPIITERTEKHTIKLERLQQIIISATKQSKHLYLPTIHEISNFKNFIQQQLPEQKFIAHCTQNSNPPQIQELYKKNTEVIICIGPEGDFTNSEVQLAHQNQFLEISLGNSILRTETAGVFVCSAIRMLNNL